MRKGFFITFEGIEGCGKSTQIRILQDRLTREGVPVRVTREPGDGEMGARIRELLLSVSSSLDPLTELFLLAADRTRHVTEIVRPALERGAVIISDRYTDSSMAYQGYGRGLPLDFIADINRKATGGLHPDLTVILDLSPSISIHRSRNRLRQQNMFEAEGRFENEGMSFHERVRDGYRKIAAQEPARVRLIDGNLPIGALATSIRKLVCTEIDRWRRMAVPHD